MIYPNKCYYTISGFSPPSKDMAMGGYGFAIGLNAGFAKKCIQFNAKMENLSRLNDMGLERLKMIFDYATDKPFHYQEKNDEPTLLLHWVQVPGNACDLGNAGIDTEDILKMKDDDLLEYYPHNVDSIKQAYGLLSLFLRWYDSAFSLVID